MSGRLRGSVSAVLALSANGRWLAAVDCKHAVRIFDLDAGKAVARLAGHADEVQSAVISDDGTLHRASRSSHRTRRGRRPSP